MELLEMELFMKSSQALIIALALLLLFVYPPWADAQQGQQGESTSSTTGTTTDTTKRTNPTPQSVVNSPTTQKTPQYMNQVIVLEGNVVTEDGSPPPFGGVIELICGTSPSRAASVDLKGGFRVEIGNNTTPRSMISDASERVGNSIFTANSTNENLPIWELPFTSQKDGYSPSVRLMGCGLRAQLPGYRSSTLMLDSGFLNAHNEVGTIVVYPIERVQGVTVSVASMLAPKGARKSMEKALKAFEKEKFDEAEDLLKSAINDYPDYGEAWFNLGQVFHKQGRKQEARDAYVRSMETDKLFVRPYIGLGWLSLSERKWQEAVDFTEQALALDPITFPEVYYMSALANLQLNRLDMAEKRARQEQRLDPKHQIPQTYLILATVLARKNDTEGTIAELQDYLKYAPNAEDAAEIRSLLKKNEQLAKTNAK